MTGSGAGAGCEDAGLRERDVPDGDAGGRTHHRCQGKLSPSCLEAVTAVTKGLGLEQLLLSLVRVHSDPGNLVLVLGCSDAEEAWLIRRMEEQVSVSLLPTSSP